MTAGLYHGMYRRTVWFSVIHCEELSSPEQREHTSTSSSSARESGHSHTQTYILTAVIEKEREDYRTKKRERKWSSG